jgi:hypothetical protein
MKYIITTAIGIMVFVSLTTAGIIMTTQFQDLTNTKAQPMNQITYLEKEKIRMDMKGDKTDMSTIFFGDKQLFWMIDNKKKSYTEITKEDLEKIQKTAEQAANTMQEALKNLPPAMQDKMKNLMPSQEAKKSEIVYKKTASDEKVNQWACDKYEGFSDGQKVAEVWTTEWKKLGLSEQDLKGFAQLGEFSKSMMKNMSFFYKVGTDEKAENMYIGFPIKTINYEKDKPANKYEIKEIKEQELAPATFEVPKGYKKEKIAEQK